MHSLHFRETEAFCCFFELIELLFIFFSFHKIIECLQLEVTHKDHQVQLLVPRSTTQNPNPVSESVVQRLLEQLGAVPTALGSCSRLYCCPQRVALPLCSLWGTAAAMRPPLSLLCSGLNKPRALSHSYIFPFRPFAIFVASLWMFSNSFVFTLWCPNLHAVLMVRLHKCRVES